MHPDLEVALAAARAGAAVVREGFESAPEVRMKGEVDPVSAVDTAAEEAVMSTIESRCPGEPTLGEESGGAGWDADRVWIVDPLDGTVNFLHGIPHFAVSVAVWEAGQAVAGVIIDVSREEEFTAAAGEGAWCNSQPMRVSSCSDMVGAVIATGFGYDRRQRAATYAQQMGEVLAEAQGIRRLGSAALDLAWVARGRYDGYWEHGLSPWDAAAGALLVSEAGGTVSDAHGAPYHLGRPTVVATAPGIHEPLVKIVTNHSTG